MTLTLHNRPQGKVVFGEKFRSPTFKVGKQPWLKRLWWAIKKFFNMRIF